VDSGGGNVSSLVSVNEDGVPFFAYRPKYVGEEEAPHAANSSEKSITGDEDGKGNGYS
jgi:hypothetical protein